MTDTDKKAVKGKDVFRFDGEGVQFKGKLIGLESVCDYRGEDVCRESMTRLKSQVLARKEHKTRIWINLKIDGVYLSSQQPGADNNVSYHLPIASISFVYKDATDARACGLIHRNFEGGEESDDTSEKRNHRFYAIKTEKAANLLLLDLKDLFQVKHEMTQKKIDEQKKVVEEEKKVDDVTDSSSSSSSSTKTAASPPSEATVGRLRAPSKAQVDLLNMESELATLNTTFSLLSTVAAAPASHSGLTDLQDVFGNVTDTYSAFAIETSQQGIGMSNAPQAVGVQPASFNIQTGATQQLYFGSQVQTQPAMFANQYGQQPIFYGQQTTKLPNSYVTNPVFNSNAALTPDANRRQMGGSPQLYTNTIPLASGGQGMFVAPSAYPAPPVYASNINVETTTLSSDHATNVAVPMLQPVLLHKSNTTPPPPKSQAPQQAQLFADLVVDIGSTEKQRSKKEMAAIMSGNVNRPTLSQLKNNNEFPK